MSDTVFVQDTLREVYSTKRFGSVKAAQNAAHVALRKHVSTITMRRVRSFFEGQAKIVRGEEKDAVRAAKIEEAKREREHLRARLDSLDEMLARVDEKFRSEALASPLSHVGAPFGAVAVGRAPATEQGPPFRSDGRLDR